MINQVTLIGHLGKDPVYSEGQDWNRCNFSLATSKRVKGKNITQWHNITLWGKAAQFVSQFAKKGSKLYVRGEIEYSQYGDENGIRRNVTNIVCRDAQLLDKRELIHEGDADGEDKHDKLAKQYQTSGDFLPGVDSDDDIKF